jgi:hypothetical protein
LGLVNYHHSFGFMGAGSRDQRGLANQYITRRGTYLIDYLAVAADQKIEQAGSSGAKFADSHVSQPPK